jgi:transposase, IS30 family
MSYVHLTATDRGHIHALRQEGKSLGYIADSLGRDRSTISRELRRNATRTGYNASHAHEQYQRRRTSCRKQRKVDYPPLWEYLFDKIPAGWTPEQIAGRLPLDFPNDPKMRISHEALYQAIYADPRMHCLIADLPQARPKRRKRGQGKSRRGPSIPNRTGIEERPKEVGERSRYGDWEGDTIVGLNQQGFIATMVERKSLFTCMRKTDSKQALEVAQAVIEAISDMPIAWAKTIPFDNGTEFARHELIAQHVPVDIYFAAPYSSYQRGTNENTNGLIRRFLPKRTDFRSVSQQQLDCFAQELNNRPRKKLEYRTPNEVFNRERQLRLVALRA